MQSVHNLSSFGMTQKEKTEMKKAVLEFTELKKKPHPYGDGKIRVHIKGKYFDYSIRSKKWMMTKYIGMKKWNQSLGIPDFLEAAAEFLEFKKFKDSYTLEERLFFGKYFGLKVKDIKNIDLDYFEWGLGKGLFQE